MLNNGAGVFTMGQSIAVGDRPRGLAIADIEPDGDMDLAVANRDSNTASVLTNDGGGSFTAITIAIGNEPRAAAFADIDGDGDQDIFTVMGGWYSSDVYPDALFRNPGHGNHWLTLRLRGRRTNRAAIGTRVRVTVNTDTGPRDIHATVSTGGSFGSTSLQQEIGLGQADSIRSVEVRWPTSGEVQVIESPTMDRILEIEEEP